MITPKEKIRSRLMLPAMVAGLIWLGFYRLSGSLGFYDDDLHFFAIVTNYDSAGELWAWIKYCWLKWPQGRPMGYTAMYSLAYFGDWLGGLAGYQLLSMLLAWINSLLLYRLVARHVNERAALPARNLVTNIGFGPRATHTNFTSPMANLPTFPLTVGDAPASLASDPVNDSIIFFLRFLESLTQVGWLEQVIRPNAAIERKLQDQTATLAQLQAQLEEKTHQLRLATRAHVRS